MTIGIGINVMTGPLVTRHIITIYASLITEARAYIKSIEVNLLK